MRNPVNCPNCRTGEHDECYIIAEATAYGEVIWCHCWDTQHKALRATNVA